jgi:carbon storage regulator CsrA
MLVLTRKCGTEIVIDGRIRIAVLKVGGGQVRLGISAPPTVPIFRRELLETSGAGQAGHPPTPRRPARPVGDG